MSRHPALMPRGGAFYPESLTLMNWCFTRAVPSGSRATLHWTDDLSCDGDEAVNDGSKMQNCKAAPCAQSGPEAAGPRSGEIRSSAISVRPTHNVAASLLRRRDRLAQYHDIGVYTAAEHSERLPVRRPVEHARIARSEIREPPPR